MTVTVARVVAQMRTYGLSVADTETLRPLMTVSDVLPDVLTLGAVKSLLQQHHITLSDGLLKQFRDHALYLHLAHT